jgi:hypothetical protein
VLRPGDALYLPRGWLHSAEALGETSVHLTIGAHPVTRHSIVEALAALAADMPELRESLPLGIDVSDPSQLAPQLTSVVEALSDWLRTADPDDVAARLRGRVWPQGRPEPVGPLEQAAALGRLDADTVVRLRRHLPHTLASRSDGQLSLRLTDRVLTLPASTETALKTLLAGAPVRVGDLPGLDKDDQVVLVRRLLREAILINYAVRQPAVHADSTFGRGDERADRVW